MPDVIVIQLAVLAEVHAQPVGEVTSTVPFVRLDGAEMLVGEIVVVHGTASCVTFTVWPAIVSVPVRCPPVFAAKASDTVPLPVPLAPLVIVTHEAALAAVHSHEVPDMTRRLPFDAVAGTARLVDESVNAQAGAACVTPKVRPPRVMDAERGVVVAFAATLYEIVPFPLPVAALVIVNHAAVLVAVQAHPLFAVTEKLPADASAATETLAGDKVKEHVAAACETVTICPPTAIVPLRTMASGLAATV